LASDCTISAVVPSSKPRGLKETGAGLNEQRRSHPAQAQLRGQVGLEKGLDIRYGLLGLLKRKKRAIFFRVIILGAHALVVQ
jgi:hypothetical protein